MILFDVDGTLIRSNRLHHDAFLHAIKHVHHVDLDAKTHTPGLTDPIILAEFSREAGIKESVVESTISDLLQATTDYYVEHFKKGDSVLLPGVNSLLATLEKKGALLALLTGNVELIAQTKLSSLGVYGYFNSGGFGSDPHKTRGELVNFALTKAGYKNHRDSVYLVGDTPRDVLAGKEAGLSHIVGVATGSYTTEELGESGAETVLKDLTDEYKALQAFGY